jgi:hypothetical protein
VLQLPHSFTIDPRIIAGPAQLKEALMLFPPLPLASWRTTRDSLHTYVRLAGAIRRALMPPQKHWWHASLRTTACGLATTPLPAGRMTCELLLDFTTHELSVSSSRGHWWDIGLEEQSSHDVYDAVLAALEQIDVRPEFDDTPFCSETPNPYNAIAVEKYWQALSQIDILLKQFRGELREETSPVQLWPHHFDLSLVWFSGRRLPEQDSPEEADEQMAFGFSTGDDTAEDPYFYVTAYPWREALVETPLAEGARWQQAGWRGALLPYEVVQQQEDPAGFLLSFWRTTQRAGARLIAG